MYTSRALPILAAALALLSSADRAASREEEKDDGSVIAIHRGGGFVDPCRMPFAHYWMKVMKGGAWEVKPLKGESRKGKLTDAGVKELMKMITAGGFDKLKSNPALGAADEPYLEISIVSDGKKVTKRIRLEEKLAEALDRKVTELAKLPK
jgi:hypothetical protein